MVRLIGWIITLTDWLRFDWLAPEQAPPKPPSKVESEHGPASASTTTSFSNKLERIVSSALGSGADASKDGNKDGGKDSNKDASSNKDAKDTTKAGAGTTESGADRGTLQNINTTVSAQNNVDLLKGEDTSGKQSPTPKSAKKGWGSRGRWYSWVSE